MNEESKVYIVDDDEAVRKALCLLMKSEGLATRDYASAEAFLAEVTPATQGCLLLDVRMPGLSGLELQQLLRKKQLAIPLIIMTGYGEVQMAVQAMKAGAIDFLEKPFDNELLLQRVHSCLRQCRHQPRHDEGVQRLERLTKRERQVMDLLVEGNQNKVIAAKLAISPRTVELHRAHVMEKLEARSLSDVVRIALAASSAHDLIAM